MSIESKISSSDTAPQVKKQWTEPSIQILDMQTAQFGKKPKGNDGFKRS